MRSTKELTLEKNIIENKLRIPRDKLVTRYLKQELEYLETQQQQRLHFVQHEIRSYIKSMVQDVYQGTPKELATRYTRTLIYHYWREQDITLEERDAFCFDIENIFTSKRVRAKYNLL